MKKTKSLLAVLGASFTLAVPLTAHAARCSDGRVAPGSTHTDGSVEGGSEPMAVPPKKEEAKPDDECIERDIYFMPGATALYFQPNRSRGAFYGAGVQIAPYQWSRNNDHFGPSQGSLYFQIAMLETAHSNSVMTLYEVGATASFERNSSRRWLIPYFGATAGGMTQSQIGTAGYVNPLAGVHLYWHRNLMVDTEGGYHFPFENVERTRGPRAELTARFSLW